MAGKTWYYEQLKRNKDIREKAQKLQALYLGHRHRDITTNKDGQGRIQYGGIVYEVNPTQNNYIKYEGPTGTYYVPIVPGSFAERLRDAYTESNQIDKIPEMVINGVTIE